MKNDKFKLPAWFRMEEIILCSIIARELGLSLVTVRHSLDQNLVMHQR